MIEPEPSPINTLKDQREQVLKMAETIEYQICSTLWNIKRNTTIDQILLWTGWSKQTLYNKWRKHGFRIKNDENTYS